MCRLSGWSGGVAGGECADGGEVLLSSQAVSFQDIAVLAHLFSQLMSIFFDDQ